MDATRGGSQPILQVRDLRTSFATSAGIVQAVDGVTFDVLPGEAFGVVGESGCGKSVTCRSITAWLQWICAAVAPGRFTMAAACRMGARGFLSSWASVARK